MRLPEDARVSLYAKSGAELAGFRVAVGFAVAVAVAFDTIEAEAGGVNVRVERSVISLVVVDASARYAPDAAIAD